MNTPQSVVRDKEVVDRSLDPENPSQTPDLEDPRVIAAVQEYLAALECGDKLSRSKFVQRHPDIAGALAICLAGLEFVHQAASGLHASALRQPLAAPSADVEAIIGTPLGDFQIVREIGRGGMGVVYEAEQLSLGRRVALKILPFAAALDPKQLQRFKNEAQAAAQLHHINIVPVFGVGCERGVHYYTMQYIDGQSLAQLIHELRELAGQEATAACVSRSEETSGRETQADGGPAAMPHLASTTLPSTSGPAFFCTVAHLGVQAAEALEHAHQLGIVHRDIKPANLLVDVRGNLWITDFGLAHCQSQAGLTMTGDLVGTLRYMSPEQALAKRPLIDHRTDVYSLGVTLYELLTLEPAFSGSDREELLQQIAFAEPLPPRKRNKAIPRELETIVLKAMEKSPEGRYATAQELSDDLRCFLEYKPIRAKRQTRVQRVSKWCRRNPLLAGALTAVVASLVLGTVVAWLLAAWALSEAKQARAAEQTIRQQLYAANIQSMPSLWDSNQVVRLRTLLTTTEQYPDRGFEWYYWQRLCHRELQTFIGHRAEVLAVSWSPDGKRLVTGCDDGTAKVWEVHNGRELFTLKGHTDGVNIVSWSPDGKRLATASKDRTAKVWEAGSGRELLALKGHLGSVWSLSWSPDGQFLATASEDGTAKVWEGVSGRPMLTLPSHASPARAVSWSADGKRLATGYWDGKVKVWDPASGQELFTLQPHTVGIFFLSWSPDGKLLATTSEDSIAKVWDAANGRDLPPLKGHTLQIWSVSWSPDGELLATAGKDRTVKVWQVASGRQLLTVQGHTDGVRSVSWSPDGKRLATGSRDGTAKVWEIAGGGEPLTLKSQAKAVHSSSWQPGQGTDYNAIRSLSWSPDGRFLATGSWDGKAKVWDAATGRELLLLEGNKGRIWSVPWSPDGKYLATASEDGTAIVWDVSTSHKMYTFKVHPGVAGDGARPVCWSPEGKLLAIGSQDGTDKLWDAASGRELVSLKGDTGGIVSVSWSPDGKLLATGTANGRVKIWEVSSGQEVRTLTGHTLWVWSVAWSPDGKQLATVSDDGTAKVWDAASGRELLTFDGHTRWLWSVSWSPDGKRVASGGSDDGTAKVWNPADGHELLSLGGHTGFAWPVCWSPDGKRLATGSGDGTVKIWDAADEVAVQEWTRQDRALKELLALSPFRGPQAQGFIQKWLLLLPVPLDAGEPAKEALDRQQIPGEAQLRPRRGETVPVGGKELVWQEYSSPEAVLDFNAVLGKVTERSVAYAACYLESDRLRNDLWLQVGCDEDTKVYLNGGPIYEFRHHSLLDGLNVRGPVPLEQGINVLLFKVMSESGNWQGCVRLVDKAGRPAKDIGVKLTPEP